MYKKINSIFFVMLITFCMNVDASDRGYTAIPAEDVHPVLYASFPRTREERRTRLLQALNAPEQTLPVTLEADFIRRKEYRNNLVDALNIMSIQYEQFARLDENSSDEFKSMHERYRTLRYPLGEGCCTKGNASDLSLYDCFWCCCWPTPTLPRLIFQLDRDVENLKNLANRELQ